MAVKNRPETPPESDRFASTPHPRDTHVLFGHEAAEAEFLDAYRAGRLPHAWIIGGPQGIGKATLAWRMARFVAAHPDFSALPTQQAKNLDLDPAHPIARKISALSFGDLALLRREWNEKTKKHFTRIGVDEVRRAIHIFEQAAGEGGWRMVIVDSADDLNASSANALLKMIEEPPARSLFLVLAHQPGRILPTITSRCRRLILHSLTPMQTEAAARAALDAAPDMKVDSGVLARACARANGSAREALRLLTESDAAFDGLVDRGLAQLPKIDWKIVHKLADATSGREGATQFDALLNAVFAWLGNALRQNLQSPAQAHPYAVAWETLERDARDLQIYNLDKRAFVLLVFSRLAEAEGAARVAG